MGAAFGLCAKEEGESVIEAVEGIPGIFEHSPLSPTEVFYPPGPLRKIDAFDDLQSLSSSTTGSSSDLSRIPCGPM